MTNLSAKKNYKKNKQKWFFPVVIIFIIANVFSLIYVLSIKQKGVIKQENNIIEELHTLRDQSSEFYFYDTLCPDIEFFNTSGEPIILSDYIGNVIVLRFSLFHSGDIPNLIYLEHIYKKFENYRMKLFFIKRLRKSIQNEKNIPFNTSVPVIEDDGYISSIFQARLNDTIIIDNDYHIKFKHNEVTNKIIYNQICRFLFKNNFCPDELSKKSLENSLKKINFINISNNHIENLGESIKKKPAVILLFVSQCLSCPEHNRITLMKYLSELDKEQTEFLLLFGKENNFEAIKKYSEQNDLTSHITVGIITSLTDKSQNYYGIFNFEVDPRMIIYNKGNIKFLEEGNTKNKVNLDYLKEMLN